MVVDLRNYGYLKTVKRILNLVDEYQNYSDEKLKTQTSLLREKYNNNPRNLKKILPAAYAVACVAAERVLGMRPYPVQILGAVAMEDRNIAEMKTGEGKTLTAIMPMYLHGLTGPGNFLITANEYLAARDAREMGKVYRWLGLSVASGVPKIGQDARDRDLTKIYGSDIVYTTNSTLGFDYLFDNLAKTQAEQHLKKLKFALLDEADAVLLDTAQTPLVISGAPRVQSNYFQTADEVVQLLVENEDYEISDDQKNTWFTPEGIIQMEQYLDIDNLLSVEWGDLYRHLILALRANVLSQRNRDYVVEDGEVVLVDEDNGRKLQGMKMQAGMHQAVEAKEKVDITLEQKSMASVTYQDLFRMFDQLAGMTGTAATDKNEFLEIYKLAVFVVPTNKPNIRKDHVDRLYVTNKAKLLDTLKVVRETYKIGRPILIETGSLELSVLYSHLLLEEGIPHSLLNARSAVKEAAIIKEAGKTGAVTVATSMAGRGTDIQLDDKAKQLGGLFVLGTERMQNKRIDNQLRGRAGRQGDPGESVFYVSLEDKIIVQNAPHRVRRYAVAHADDKNQVVDNKFRLRHAIDKAQKLVVNQQRNARFETLQYGEIERVQRDSIYQQRNMIMNQKDLKKIVDKIFKTVAHDYAYKNVYHLSGSSLSEFIYQNIDPDFKMNEADELTDKKSLESLLLKVMENKLKQVNEQLAHPIQWLYFEKLAILKAIDQGWVEQVDQLAILKRVTKSRAIAQTNPVFEFQKEAQRAFNQMRKNVNLQIIQNLTNSEVIPKEDGTVDIDFP